MSRFVIIQGHPDASKSHLNHALAERYAQAAAAAGHQVRHIDVGRMVFPMLRDPQEFVFGDPPATIVEAQQNVAWADRIVFFYPLWIGDVPAALKAFLEQTFRPGFAMEYGGKHRFPKGLLTGKSARIVVTMGMPAFVYRTAFKAHSLQNLRLNLRLCGVRPVRATLLGNVEGASGRCRQRWLKLMEKLAARDALLERKRKVAIGAVAAAAATAAAAYLTYAALAWARFGKSQSTVSTLLDRVMPEFDVRFHHEINIQAPSEIAFEAVNRTNLGRSPIVAALFRAREILLRAKHAEGTSAQGLREQLESFGWCLLAEEPGRELVFGAIAQPWKPNPVFIGTPAEQFARFREPDYAKIAFTLRVDPAGDSQSRAQTETRVETTDANSRKKFRRYWALLSPGMELIRIVLLAQIKTEAESTVRAPQRS